MVSFYINFVLHAILGKLAEADGLLETYGSEIRHVARALNQAVPFERKPLHRGLLLVRGEFEFAEHGEGRTFTSWSENQLVARWFADPLSSMNSYMLTARPSARGYTLTLAGEQPLVLFHHSWRKLQDLPSLALQHPYMGIEGARQIAWALETQAEVITDPPSKWPELRENALGYDPILDRQLSPPWIPLAERRTRALEGFAARSERGNIWRVPR